MPRFPRFRTSATNASSPTPPEAGDSGRPEDTPHEDRLLLPQDDSGIQTATAHPQSAHQETSQQSASHRSVYSDERFWQKMTRFGKRAGREVALKALQLYFVLKRPDVPFWAKSTIIGALGYFISPLDAIPDFIAGVGYTDDASVLAAALVAVSIYIDEDIKRQAESALSRWWPEAEPS